MRFDKYFRSEAPDTFYTLDKKWIERNAKQIVECFPGKVLYAVKANPLPEVLDALVSGGIANFDVASMREVIDVAARVPAATQYLMNPVKSRADIDAAYRTYGLRAFVVDSEEELRKIRDVLPSSDPDITLFVRYAPSESDAVFDLRGKFGASVEDTLTLADLVKSSTRWKLGLSFHVGSQVTKDAPYLHALEDAKRIIEYTGSRVQSLDVGGGFPGFYMNSQGSAVSVISSVANRIDDSPLLRSLDILCEVGRGLVYGGMSLFARVLLRRKQDLFCGAGIFGGLLSAQNWLQFPVRAWRSGRIYDSDDRTQLQLFGPTCDSMDRLAFSYLLPDDIAEGDWLEFQSVGAYSVSLRAPFNGFYTQDVIHVDR
ncbi:MAG: hypothetical protein ACRYHA_32925 [Janthinobacterium lividum]